MRQYESNDVAKKLNRDTAKHEKPKSILKSIDLTAPISESNILDFSNVLVLLALKTIHAKSGDNYILELRKKLLKYINSGYNYEYVSEASDLPSIAADVLVDYIGKTLNEDSEELFTRGEKKGSHVSIRLVALRSVHKYIYSEKKRVAKRVAIEFIDESNETQYITPPAYWHVDTIYDYKRVLTLLKLMELTSTQKKIVVYIMKGYNHSEIARRMGISQPCVVKHVNNIRVKALKVITDLKINISAFKKDNK